MRSRLACFPVLFFVLHVHAGAPQLSLASTASSAPHLLQKVALFSLTAPGAVGESWAAVESGADAKGARPSESAEAPPTNASLLVTARDGTAADVLRLLAEGADVNERDEWGQTPLMYAATADNVDTMRVLLNARAEVDAVTPAGWTALMYAARDARTGEAVRLLLEHSADLERRNAQGSTALDLANPVGRAAIERVLAEREEEERAAAERARTAQLRSSVSEALGEQQTELRKFEVRGDWVAAWYEMGGRRAIYLVDMGSGRYCQWLAVPRFGHGQQGWNLATGGFLDRRIEAAIRVQPFQGLGTQAEYWMETSGLCRSAVGMQH